MSNREFEIVYDTSQTYLKNAKIILYIFWNKINCLLCQIKINLVLIILVALFKDITT